MLFVKRILSVLTKPSLFRTMAIMAFFLMLVQINRVGGGVLASEITDTYSLSPTVIGLVIGSMFFAAALVQVPVGLMLDAFGARRTLVGLSLIAVSGMILISFASGAAELIVGRILVGVGHGASITGVYLVAVVWTSPERVSTVAAITIAVGGALGGILGTAPLAISLETLGFSDTFILLAIASLFSSFLIWKLIDDKKSFTEKPNTGEGLAGSLVGFFEVIKDRNLWPIFAMALCFSFPFATIGGLWASPFLQDLYKLTSVEAGGVILVMAFGVNLGTFLYGPLERIFNSRKWIVLSGVMVMIVSLLILAAMPTASLILVTVLLSLFSLASPIFVTLAGHARGYVHETRSGRVLATVNFLGVGFIFVVQFLTGSLFEVLLNFGFSTEIIYRVIFLGVAIFLFFGFIFYSFSRDLRPTAIETNS
tara:strand:+ start:104 stop:1375 length:1272 start_codon:yes stop_codon:yes gene_type:complete